MFVLIMLFLFKYIDDLIGKGFEWYVILELLCYAAATNIAMALPLSMLLSSIMTFGNLGESYELVAIKAAGVSLRKAMMPLFFLVALFAAGSFLFSDYILPVANLKMGSLLYDVRNKKADFFIKAGVFNTTIPGYAIRAKDKSEDGTVLYDLTIYDKTKGSTGSNVLMAEEGFMYNSRDQNYMI
jgi:lipopolysaccharide export system permease protein